AGGSLARLGVAGVDPASFRIVWRSPLLRYGPHAVRDDIAPERAERLAWLLEGVAGGGANPGRRILRGHGGFAAVTAADYAPAMEAVSALSNPGRRSGWSCAGGRARPRRWRSRLSPLEGPGR